MYNTLLYVYNLLLYIPVISEIGDGIYWLGEQLYNFAQSLYDFLTGLLDMLITVLNPIYWIVKGIEALANMLPTALFDRSAILDTWDDALDSIEWYVGMFGYFTHLDIWLVVVAGMMATEVFLFFFRIWRMTRSTIT